MDRQSQEHIQGILSRQIDAVFFDLDGTLINSSKDIAISANYALEKLGFPKLNEEEIVKHIGYGGENLLRNILPVNDDNILKKAVEIFKKYYFSNPVIYTKPYELIPEILESLKKQGKKIAVITNKYYDISKEILEKLDIFQYIDLLLGGDSVKNKKPYPEPVLKAIESLNVKVPIIIGDSETDIKSGKDAGIKTVLVEYGFGKIDLAKSFNPDFIVKNTKELRKLLCE
ncbi:MAG TPA: HAD family hydrolase [Persephonella sp.]|nr:HAD family hydrolase [Persephonella sp.]